MNKTSQLLLIRFYLSYITQKLGRLEVTTLVMFLAILYRENTYLSRTYCENMCCGEFTF